jgi:hypothetical protein
LPARLDGGIVLAALKKFIREPATRVDVAGYLYLGLGAAQFAVRIDHAFYARPGAACGAAAEYPRQDLHHDIGNGADRRQQCDGPYPQSVSAALDHMHDQAGLDDD